MVVVFQYTMDGDSYIFFGIGLAIGAFLVYLLMRSIIQRKVKDARKESTNAQRSTIKGQITEQLVPLFPQFTEKFEVGDARFLGSPIDFVIFRNMSKFDKKSDQNIPIEIEFVEIKSGKKQGLEPIEKAVELACKKKDIPFWIVSLNTDKKI